MKSIHYILTLILFGTILYFLTIKGAVGNPDPTLIHGHMDKPTQAFELSPERGRFALVMSLAENGSFSLSEDLMKAAYPDVGYWQGRFYTYFAPGISLLAVPFYVIGKLVNLSQVASFLAISLFALANLVFIFKIGQRVFNLPDWSSFLAALIFGFASTSWSYAGTLYQHHVTAFLILSSFYWAFLFKQGGQRSWVWASLVWMNYGLALLIDYPNLFLLLPVALYLLASSISAKSVQKRLEINVKTAVFVTSIFFILLNFGHAYYNYANFGDWRRLSGSLIGYKEILQANQPGITTSTSLPDLKNQNINPDLVAHLEENKSIGNFFKEQSLPFGFFTLLFASDKGLFFFSPIFIMAAVGAFLSLKKMNAELMALLGIIGVNLVLYASWDDPWGGWAFGPRYLIPAMALMALFVGLAFSRIKNFWLGRLLPFLVIAYSVGISLLGVLTTNAVPPQVEADYLHSKFGFFLAWDYFVKNQSSSFIYNEVARNYLTLPQYYLIIYTLLILLFYAAVFWLSFPKKSLVKEEHS